MNNLIVPPLSVVLILATPITSIILIIFSIVLFFMKAMILVPVFFVLLAMFTFGYLLIRLAESDGINHPSMISTKVKLLSILVILNLLPIIVATFLI